MADITGTNSGETLNGTGDDDLITALNGNDTVNAGGGNDIIYGGLGTDILNGDDGDDLFIEDDVTFPSDVFNGGIGLDTIELRTHANAVLTSLGSLSSHNLSAASSMNSIERLVFASTPGLGVQSVLSLASLGASGLTEIIGGSGRDILTISTGNGAGSFTMPTLPLTSWDTVTAITNAWEYTGDLVLMNTSAAAGTQVTLNALAGFSIFQAIGGGGGDDTLNGSANADWLIATAGGDTVNAGDGNDAIIIINQWNPTGSSWNPPTTFSGAGGNWNGGDGTDVISVGGEVYLAATLSSIEGVFLQPAFFPALPVVPRQDAALLHLDSAHAAMLPSNAFFAGTGQVLFELDIAASFSAAAFTFSPGSTVDLSIFAPDGDGLTFTGSTGGDIIVLGAGTQIASGGDGNDHIQFGAGAQTVTGGAGVDYFGPGMTDGVVTDFTIGTDKIDLSGSTVFNQDRFFDLLSQSAGGARISAQTTDGYFQMTLQGVSAASITVNDVALGIDDGFGDFDTGTSAAEYFFGNSGVDEFHGGEGADRFYAGGGLDRIYGDGGDDTIVLDGAFNFGVTFDGGTGTDTLLLRRNAGSVANGPTTSYFVFPGAPGTGLVSIERLVFDSSSQYGLTFITTTAPSFTEVVGGAGTDLLVLVATGTGTYSMPAFTLSNWGGGDQVGMSAQANTAFDVTFNGRNDIGQFLIGQGGNDTLNGGALADTLRGGAGNDTLTGNGGADQFYGEAGNDRLVVGSNGVAVDGGSETDTLVIVGTVSSFANLANLEAIELVGGANLTLTAAQFNTGFYNPIVQLDVASVSGTGSLVFNMDANPVASSLFLTTLSFAGGSSVTLTVNGTSGIDAVKGAAAVANTINGGDGIDQLRGGNLGDTINGGNGDDKLFGWGGADILTGGTGSDQFRYFFATDSGTGVNADRITDFELAFDKFNFVLIDADPVTPDDQEFAFLGTGAFTSPGTGQIRYQDSGADLLVQVDVDGNGSVDMEMILQGLAGATLSAGNFML